MAANLSIDEIKLLDARYSMKDVEEENAAADDEASPLNMDMVCGNKYIEKELQLIVTVEVSCNAPSLPFNFNVKYGAAYSLSEKPTKDEMERFVNVICPFQIMPYISEFVSELTRRAGHEPLLIPPVNFVAIEKERKEKEAAASDSNE